MTFTKPGKDYWERKLIAYMHDPLDKVFRIQGHEERAAQFLDKYGLQKPNEGFWKRADGIAAGFERGQVPTYNPDPNKNGAVDFLKRTIITHPTSEKAQLSIEIPHAGIETTEQFSSQLLAFVEKEIGMKPGQGGYSDQWKGEDSLFSVARFLYTHLILRFKLAENNIGGLGAFWHRIPADSRFPDHSIWQHNALCSSIYSCIELAGSVSEIGLMAFSITPVQPFIAKARKLRDYWTGSVLLSWLAFEGMRWVIENLGPDHILYPSLIDQPLVNEYLKMHWKTGDNRFLNAPEDIATFPNKFLFLVPMNLHNPIAAQIREHLLEEWKNFFHKVEEKCTSMMSLYLSEDEKAFVDELFERQNGSFWDFQWAAAYLVEKNDLAEIEKLLPETSYRNQFDVLDLFNRIIEDKHHYEKDGRGVLYSVSHSLLQSALAVSKMKKRVTRLPETGEKCHLCGEFEVLHHKRYRGDVSANEYKKDTKFFWSKLKEVWDGDDKNQLGYNLNAHEKLCSICLVKRMACDTVRGDTTHILHSVLGRNEGFPSTTDVALTTYFQKGTFSEQEKRRIAQAIHEKVDDKTENEDRYFAILLMDGDNMGKLVNGETLASRWDGVMHPDIVEALQRPGFEKSYHENWKEIFQNKNTRLLTPAIHAAISECLGDFSLYGVASIIQSHKGKLIYAGGDDVCAVLPVEESLDAAFDIQQYYNSTYKLIEKDKPPLNINSPCRPSSGKLSINLGVGEYISISAGILICHHKESLTQMIERAHHLLNDKAKNVEGKSACAIELRKRSGGSRYFVRRWDEAVEWTCFREIGEAIKSRNKAQVSSSLVHRLEKFRAGIEAILEHDNAKVMLQALIAKQLDRSSIGDESQLSTVAEQMTNIVVCKGSDGKPKYQPEGLIVAGFMAKRGDEHGVV